MKIYLLLLLLLFLLHCGTPHYNCPAYIIYQRNTSVKGLSSSQGWDTEYGTECQLFGYSLDNDHGNLSRDSTDGSCGDCDFNTIKGGYWYRFKGLYTTIAEIGSSELTTRCPSAGHCNGNNQILLTPSYNETGHIESQYYRIVVAVNGTCRALGGNDDDFESLVEKNDCDGFYVYRFPKFFDKLKCVSGDGNSTTTTTSICMDDSKKGINMLYIVAGVLASIFIILVAIAPCIMYRKRIARKKSAPIYHGASNRNRNGRIQTMHSYADLDSIGFTVSLPPPINTRPPTVLVNNTAIEGLTAAAAADQDRPGSSNQLQIPRTGPTATTTSNPAFDRDYLVPDELRVTKRPHSYVDFSQSRLTLMNSDDYMVPDELLTVPRSKRLHSYINVPRKAPLNLSAPNSPTCPEPSTSSANRDPLAPLAEHSDSQRVENRAEVLEQGGNSPGSVKLDENSLTVMKDARSSTTSEVKVEDDYMIPDEMRTGTPAPEDGVVNTARSNSCCREDCSNCTDQSAGHQEETKQSPIIDSPPQANESSQLSTLSTINSTQLFSTDPLSFTSLTLTNRTKIVDDLNNVPIGTSVRNCCKCNCYDHHKDRYFRVQSV